MGRGRLGRFVWSGVGFRRGVIGELGCGGGLSEVIVYGNRDEGGSVLW